MVSEDMRKKALEDARATVAARLQARHSDMSENEQALFLVIEQHLGLNRQKCMELLRAHKQREFDRLVVEEYNRNLAMLKDGKGRPTDYFKMLENIVVPVKVTDEQKILGWGFRFKDEVTGSKSPPIREIFRQKNAAASKTVSINDRERFIQEVRSEYDGKIFEHHFDRMQVGWEPGKKGTERFFTVKFMLRAC
ncbi:MAG TPA: hypothetical protein VMD05_05480 [Candidatus Nanoarchaeia archaeon]|nr:hypothetical protein [Candidatus Nanoarchaeia archaeon]